MDLVPVHEDFALTQAELAGLGMDTGIPWPMLVDELIGRAYATLVPVQYRHGAYTVVEFDSADELEWFPNQQTRRRLRASAKPLDLAVLLCHMHPHTGEWR